MAQQPQQFTPNEAMSLGDRLNYALEVLASRRDEISAVLPPDIKFEAFHATANQALRANPDLLQATSRSLINAFVKAAYDGLRVDGKEAAIVVDNVRVSKPGQPDKYEKQARYMPMYQGLCQQLYRGGLVLSCEAHVVYANDEWSLEPTAEPPIRHRPLIIDQQGRPVQQADRGAPILVYNIARLASGTRSFAWMSAFEVQQVQMESRSGWDAKNNKSRGVWLKWEAEQWKKTVLRRHRKTLPVGMLPIRDMEATDEFPQFDTTTPHPALAGPAPSRPTRESIAHQPDVSVNDFGDNRGETIEAERGQQQDRQHDQRQQNGGGRQQQQAPEQQDGDGEVPDSPQAWAVWGSDVEKRIAGTNRIADLMTLQQEIRPVLNEATKAIKDRLNGLFTNRAADVAADTDDGAAAGETGDGTAAGDGN